MSDFYKYFKENMDALGVPCPESLFGTVQMATATAATILGGIDKFGKSVTVGELIGAGTRLEWLATVGALSAAFVVGAIIGSIAVAAGRTLAGGASISDAIDVAIKYGLHRSWLSTQFHHYPGLYDRKLVGRGLYRYGKTSFA